MVNDRVARERPANRGRLNSTSYSSCLGVAVFTSSALSSRSGISLDDIDAPWLDDLPRQPDGTVAAMDVWRALDAIDTSRFADAEHLELVELWRRIGSACAARRLHHMAEFATTPVMGRGSDGQVREHADDELALRTRCARRKTSHELATALMLRDVLPGTRAALARGVIDVPRAAAIADACLPLGPTAALRVELEVLARAAFQDPRAVARASARAVMVIDAASIETRRKAAPKTRYVSGQPAPDGMADMFAHLPAMDWVVISSAINAAARAVKATGDSRTLEQLRVDALVAPFAKALRTGILDGLDPITLARHRGIRPSVHVHVTAEALLGLSRTPPISRATVRSPRTWRVNWPLTARGIDCSLTPLVELSSTSARRPIARLRRWRVGWRPVTARADSLAAE